MATTKQAKAKYQKAYNRRPSAVKKRVEANRGRRELGLKKGSTKDAAHQPGGGFKAESRSKNRAHGGRIGNKAGKAAGGRKSSRKGVPNKK
jgi:hypothetical protein